MVKKYLVLLVLALVAVSPVLAREESSSKSGNFLSRLIEMKRNAFNTKTENLSKRLCEVKKSKKTEATRMVNLASKRLTDVKKKTAQAKIAGKDVSGVEILIAEAEVKMAAATAAIPGDVTCPTFEGSNARIAAQAALDELKAKLETAKSTLQEANKAIADATSALRIVLGGAKHE